MRIETRSRVKSQESRSKAGFEEGFGEGRRKKEEGRRRRRRRRRKRKRRRRRKRKRKRRRKRRRRRRRKRRRRRRRKRKRRRRKKEEGRRKKEEGRRKKEEGRRRRRRKTNLLMISRAMVVKASSTFVAFLAEVSRKGMPRLSEKSLAVPNSTSFLVAKSHLLPTRSLLTFSQA